MMLQKYRGSRETFMQFTGMRRRLRVYDDCINVCIINLYSNLKGCRSQVGEINRNPRYHYSKRIVRERQLILSYNCHNLINFSLNVSLNFARQKRSNQTIRKYTVISTCFQRRDIHS